MTGIAQGEIVDFSANLNPLGPPAWLRPVISAHLSEVVHYPDPDCLSLIQTAAVRYGVGESEIIAGNGSTEHIYLIPRAISRSRAVVPVPAYIDYAVAAGLAGLAVEKIFLKEEDGFAMDLNALEAALHGDEMVFIGQPRNPTGLLCSGESLRGLAHRNPASLFIVDEAFADFVDGMDSLTRNRPANVIVLCSLTKFYAIPGLRLGLAIGDTEIIGRMKEMTPPWSVGVLAQVVGEAALKDDAYARQTVEYVRQQRMILMNELQSMAGLTVYPGKANYLLVRIDRKDRSAQQLKNDLLIKGIAIRTCENFDGLDDRFFRIAVRSEADNSRLCHALRDAIGVSPKLHKKRNKPAIMFQGTSSNAGKSILTAAFCRILLQDGYRVAPFKSQNMSLNSFVTQDGGEMGRAQVVQAQACRLSPDVRMNPILLKPNSDKGSQVIVMGKAIGNMDVGAYIQYKPRAFEAAKEAYASLAAEHDVIVLEGAGSPGEVNLKHHDIVNMAMARHARSPVLIVGDIDRGGVFASFAGTMEVLSEWERALVAGFVVNRFRGDESLLKEALDYTLFHTGRPTFGVVPYLRDLGLPEEDSVSFKSVSTGASPAGEHIEIALVDLPHISNFTDFDALRAEPDVHLRIVRAEKDLGVPDVLILPGSKNVIDDLQYLKNSGLAKKISCLAEMRKTELIGICGGFQILGGDIADPFGIESNKGQIQGLGLLPIRTTLGQDKILTSTHGRHLESALSVKGYEIHHGLTEVGDLMPSLVGENGEILGIQSPDGLVWGTYLHGVFDADPFRRWFLDRLRVRLGFQPIGKILMPYDLEPAFDRLADVVRRSLKIREIYRLMGLSE
ncbi:MAG: Cobyric acid synthase [Syntrophus sp. SKADARSKE-3]|nr:Cobyric acid synthase [Syntrophus sp. SKADARSKE-3]